VFFPVLDRRILPTSYSGSTSAEQFWRRSRGTNQLGQAAAKVARICPSTSVPRERLQEFTILAGNDVSRDAHSLQMKHHLDIEGFPGAYQLILTRTPFTTYAPRSLPTTAPMYRPVMIVTGHFCPDHSAQCHSVYFVQWQLQTRGLHPSCNIQAVYVEELRCREETQVQ
jgi:hypothetical protein